MHINITIPASVLDEINIHVDRPVGQIRLHVEDDWLVVKALASTIKFRPCVESDQIVLQDPEVKGLLWPARSKVIKSLEESVKKIVLPNASMSINEKEIQISLGIDLEIPPFLRKLIDKSPSE
ncbi:hypothetical protein KSF_035570 [Reticulibacter mediterranei]|uniref:Uncharacterized protein n=1 Tax=Reticulibacter mediterranei TaxID=2778369 RepID=A0A8J3IDR2_9CHLR|nr:hypothetical protein [Reticulibacter mediterranei]GHO93509.1 hypothetical protein KSF_035570 [Reticulibacter mediterranei]